MRRLRAMIHGLPADSAIHRAALAETSSRPALPPPMQRGRTSADTIRKFGGRIVEAAG